MAERTPRKLAIILHADVVGSTALVRIDETLAHERIRDAFHRFSKTIEAYGGVALELRGDALVAEFPRASDAIAAALAFQARNSETNSAVDDDVRPRLRIGISMGEVVIADNTITGAGVVLAQRLEQLAESGGVCIQGAAYETVPRRLPFQYESLGEQQVKGFEEPVRAYAVALKPDEEIPAPDPAAAPDGARPGRAGSRWIVAGGIVLLLMVVGALAWWQPWRSELEPASVDRMAYPLPDKPSIAVLPFDNLSGDPEQGYLADGMTENLIATLAQVPELFVIARNSVFTYKGKPTRVQRVAEELGIRYVLEGSIQRAAERLRITVQLIDATGGHHLWSERYDRDMGNLFDLQDEIALKTTQVLQVKLTGARPSLLRSNTTKDVRAWLAFVKGLGFYEQYTEEGHERARELYQSAVELDPQFADAWIGLGWIHWNDARFRRSADSKASLGAADEMADKAAAIAPDHPGLFVLRGQIHLYRDEFDRALAALRRAVELSPSDASAVAVLGQTLLYAGQYDESIRLTERAMRLNPFFPSWFLLNLGRAMVLTGRYDRGIEAAEQGLARAEGPLMTAAHRITLAMAYADSGDLDRARQTIGAALERFPNVTIANYAERYRFKNQAEWERFSGILRAAGLPEGEKR